MNFVKCHRSPIVFRHLQQNQEGRWELAFAGSKKTEFTPDKLVRDQEGYLLYEVSFGEIVDLPATFDTDLAL